MLRDDELRAILQQQYDAALGESSSSQLSKRREEALKAYRGELYGNERAGRSKVISWDVFDVVESALPSLLKIFVSTDEIVEFEPVGQEDVEIAKQASDYINYVFLKDNNGFNVLSTWFKDALLQINGFVKVYWEESEKWVYKEYTGQTAEQIALLLDRETEYKISGQERRTVKTDDGVEIEVFDVILRCKKVIKKARVVPCAPEDIGKAPGTLDIQEASYSYHRFEKFASDLIEMGYDKKLVEQAANANDTLRSTEESISRELYENETGATPEIDKSMRPVVVTEHYIRIDYDGDGIAELRKVTTGGTGTYVILDNTEISENPLVEISPILLPHQSYGMALSEPVMPVQEVKTVIQRQLLDNFYNVNNKRPIVDQNLANENTIGDLLNAAPGYPIRTNGRGAIDWMDTPALGGESFNLLEYQDSLIEQRSGITRYNQGLDADSLNKTATGIQIIQNASQERLMLIARFFGEGVRQMFAKLLRLTIQHQDIPRTFRLRNEWVTVDPRTWNMEMDVNISVGLGTGNKDQMLMHLTTLFNMQKELVMGGVMPPEYLLHTGAKMAENMGFKNTEAFFPDEETMQQMQQNPQPDPEQVKAEQEMAVEQQKMAFEQEKAAAQMNMQAQSDQQKMSLEQEKSAAQMQLEREKAMMQMQFEREKFAMQLESQERIEAEKIASQERTQMHSIQRQTALPEEYNTVLDSTQQQSQGIQMALEGIAQVAQMIEQAAMTISLAAQQMNAPKSVTVIRDGNGRIKTANVVAEERVLN